MVAIRPKRISHIAFAGQIYGHVVLPITVKIAGHSQRAVGQRQTVGCHFLNVRLVPPRLSISFITNSERAGVNVAMSALFNRLKLRGSF